MQIVKTFEIKNKLGIHARAAAKIVEVANRFHSDVFLEKDGCEVDGRSILDILTIYCPKGCSLTVRFTGVDADEAMKKMSDLIESKFGEI
jgi:phosphocarrier protein HPr